MPASLSNNDSYYLSLGILCISSYYIINRSLYYSSNYLAKYIWKNIFKKNPGGYGNNYKEYNICVYNSSLNDRTYLNSIDYFQMRFIRSFVYLYSDELEINSLKESLKYMIKLYPQVGGIYEKDIKTNRIFINYRSPNVKIIEQEYNKDNDFINILSNSSWNNPIWFDFIPQLETEYPVILGKPLMEVKVSYIHCNNTIYTIIGIGFSHGLNDACSAFHFINEWAKKTNELINNKITKVKLIKPDHNRSKISDIGRISFSKHEAFKYGFQIQPYLWFLFKLMFYKFISKDKTNTIEHFYFSNDILQEYKSQIINSNPDVFNNMIISRNDILSALFWKLRHKYEDRHWIYNTRLFNYSRRLTILVNIRNKITSLKDNYFGNALLFTNHYSNSIKDLDNLSISQLVIQVRELVNSCNISYTNKAIGILNEHVFNKNTDALLGLDPPVEYPLHTMITNWSKFDIYGADFGIGKPLRFIYPLGFNIPGFIIIIPSSDNKGLEVILSGTTTFMKQLKDLEITSKHNINNILKE